MNVHLKSLKDLVRACIDAVALPAAVLLAGTAVSCGDGNGREPVYPARVAAALSAVDDSSAANSPHTLDMMKAGLRGAGDSLEYCEWYLRLMRYTVQRDISDTSALRWDEPYDYLKSLRQTPHVRDLLAMLLNTKASYYHKLHYDPSIAVGAYREAYGLLFGSDREDWLPDICANMGDAYVADNDMPLAAFWYRRALFLSDSLRLPSKDKVTLYMGLGRIYLNLGDYDSALDCYKTADSNFGLLPLNMKMYFLTNYGNYYYYTGDYKSAEAVFMRMYRLLVDNDMSDTYEMYLCKVNMADVYLNLGRTAEASRLANEVNEYFTRIGDETAMYYSHTILMALALRDGDIATVRRILSEEKFTTTIDFNLVNIRQRYLREYYVRLGDYKSAYENIVSSVERNDSLKHNISNMRASEIMMRYAQDTLTLHHKLELQAKDADIRSARFGLFVGLLLVVALVLLLLFFYTFARKRMLQQQVQLMRLRLMNVRSRISPHFIFNVLNNRISHADKNDADELMALVKLIRANLKMSGKYYVSLKEELDFVRYYISVARHSIDGDFEFSIEAPDDSVLEGIMVPSMFIQILVENSIKHGLKRREGPKRLRVKVTQETDSYRVTVTDNGTGFDIRQGDPSSTHTGMKVIRNTISAINHDNKKKVRLDVRNIETSQGSIEGCEVTLELPRGLKPVGEI